MGFICITGTMRLRSRPLRRNLMRKRGCGRGMVAHLNMNET